MDLTKEGWIHSESSVEHPSGLERFGYAPSVDSSIKVEGVRVEVWNLAGNVAKAQISEHRGRIMEGGRGIE